MSDTKYIELVTWNKKMILMHGEKLTPTQRAIGLRSNGLHSEIRFSGRHGWISFSCTTADGCGYCRFKMIDYSHPYRQSRVRIPVTAEQEAKLFTKACGMADMDELHFKLNFLDHGYIDSADLFYGPNAIKYDEWGARLSFISRNLNWWKMHPDYMICNEACAEVLKEVWRNIIAPHHSHDLTPDQLEYQVRYYFERKSNE